MISNWRPGIRAGTVVGDAPNPLPANRVDDVEYYGGDLVAESIDRADVPVIAAARELLQVVRDAVVECERSQRLSVPLQNRMRAVIGKATA